MPESKKIDIRIQKDVIGKPKQALLSKTSDLNLLNQDQINNDIQLEKQILEGSNEQQIKLIQCESEEKEVPINIVEDSPMTGEIGINDMAEVSSLAKSQSLKVAKALKKSGSGNLKNLNKITEKKSSN